MVRKSVKETDVLVWSDYVIGDLGSPRDIDYYGSLLDSGRVGSVVG